jgi:hypothetical protein
MSSMESYMWSGTGLSVRPPACLDRPPALPSRPPHSPDKEIFEYIRVYSSIFEYIQAYLSIFEVFLKNIQRIYLVCPICARCNGQDRLPACLPATLTR